MPEQEARVLVVEDDPVVRETVRLLLEEKVSFTETSTGSEALRVIELEPPDCILMDDELPDYDGLALLELIDTDRFPIVMLRDQVGEMGSMDAIERGAIDCLSKLDLTAESLGRSIRLCLDRNRGRARAFAAESRRDVFDEAPVMYVLTRNENDASVIQDCNRLFTARLGYSRDDVIGKPLLEFYTDRSIEGLELDRSGDILERRSMVDECELLRKDGDRVPVLVHTVPEGGAGRRVRARVMFIDIGRWKESEEALRRSEAEMRTLLDAIPDVLLKLRQYDGDLIFEPVRTETRLDDENPVRAAHATLPKSAIRDFRRHTVLAIDGGPPVRFEYELEVDGTPRIFEARLVRRARDELLAIIRDETRDRELEQQLLQSQRLEALGKLAGGVAHDFNNFLTVISGNAELALVELEEGDANVEVYREIVETSVRAADLTRQLLAFSRQQVLKPRVIDLSELVARTEKMLRRLIGEDIEISTRLAADLPRIEADPGQVEQILMNLAVNARDAMPQGGKLAFETDIWTLAETEIGHDFNIPSGCYVRLRVTDTGAGMDEKTRDRVFEPFFSTKESGKGTGLGLATAYGIVKQSDGYILVDSEPAKGTTFSIYFPCATEIDHETLDALEDTPSLGQGETVVFVEDDPGVLSLARSILEGGGYRVAAFEKGEDAVRFVQGDPEGVDLLATDVVMPGMSGPTVASGILKVRQNLPILYVSGYTEDARTRHGIREAEMNFLEKPFSRAELLSAVRDALELQP